MAGSLAYKNEFLQSELSMNDVLSKYCEYLSIAFCVGEANIFVDKNPNESTRSCIFVDRIYYPTSIDACTIYLNDNYYSADNWTPDENGYRSQDWEGAFDYRESGKVFLCLPFDGRDDLFRLLEFLKLKSSSIKRIVSDPDIILENNYGSQEYSLTA